MALGHLAALFARPELAARTLRQRSGPLQILRNMTGNSTDWATSALVAPARKLS